MNKVPFWAFCALLPFLAGCAVNDSVIKTRYVPTPTYCSVDMPEKPKLLEGSLNIVSNFRNLLIYKDQLEVALHCCRGDEECNLKEE